jgi:hypothetical protein
MKNKIEETLGLPKMSDMVSIEVESNEYEITEVQEPDTYVVNTNEFDRELERHMDDRSQIKIHEREMDEIADLAHKAYRDTLDLGFNVEHRNAGPILETSSNYLKLMLEARKSKSEQRLKMIKLTHEKERLMNDTRNKPKDEYVVGEDGVLANRNEIMKYLREKSKEKEA